MMTFLWLPLEDASSFPSLVALVKYIWLFIQQIAESGTCSPCGRLELFMPSPQALHFLER